MIIAPMPTAGAVNWADSLDREATHARDQGFQFRIAAEQAKRAKFDALLNTLAQIRQERMQKKAENAAKNRRNEALGVTIGGTVLGGVAGGAALGSAAGALTGASVGANVGGGIASAAEGNPGAGGLQIARGIGSARSTYDSLANSNPLFAPHPSDYYFEGADSGGPTPGGQLR